MAAFERSLTYVVSHVGLNNDANWRDFREFDLEDQQIFREWLEAQGDEDTADSEGTGTGRPRRFDEGMLESTTRSSRTL